MTRKQFYQYVRDYMLLSSAQRIETLLSMAKHHADFADKLCDKILKDINEIKDDL